MAYSFQTFTVNQVLTAAQVNQIEVNVRDHVHGNAGVSNTFDGGSVTWTNAVTHSNAHTFSGNVTVIGDVSGIKKSTRQIFLSGTAATYTTPTGCRQIQVRMKGPGGSTSGSSDLTADFTTAAAGTATLFNAIGAAAGAVGATQVRLGCQKVAAGGSGGAGAATMRRNGSPGGPTTIGLLSATVFECMGGHGGGEGGGITKSQFVDGSNAGVAGAANTGGGASGAGITAASQSEASGRYASPGGGEGEEVLLVIDSPAATYLYTVGTAGTAGAAGTGGYAGAVGGLGIIVVDEYY